MSKAPPFPNDGLNASSSARIAAGLAAFYVLSMAVEAVYSAEVPSGYSLVYQQDFAEDSALQDFVMTDPEAWRIAMVQDGEGDRALELAKQSQYQPKVRSPVNIALLADRRFEDFVLEVKLRQTGREYGHRDMCLFFGVEDPSRFYYAHMATKADDHAHNVFIVKDAPRAKIADKTTAGVNWGLEVWHKVRLEREAESGVIRVFYDDMKTPIMEANDKSFRSGYLGFGSFDDTGMIDEIRVWAPRVLNVKTDFYRRP